MDGMSLEESLKLAREVEGWVWGFKVHDLLIREGFGVIREFKKYGNVFADLKFHDIPETVRKEVAALADAGADLLTVHTSGGVAMLEAAVAAGGERVVAVTAFTSLSAADIHMIYHISPAEAVEGLARTAAEASVRNIVCSPQDIAIVKHVAPHARIVCPGIRGPNDEKDDQARTMSAREAVDAGADLLVIGRPITKAPDPRAALENIISTLP